MAQKIDKSPQKIPQRIATLSFIHGKTGLNTGVLGHVLKPLEIWNEVLNKISQGIVLLCYTWA